eukprot:m.25583 g.25583  ORF g.25583 m.25583 type:complete len:477 (+) comp7718_c0_seq1:183-1613(+)
MSLLRSETVQAIADGYGFPDLLEEVASALTADLEYRIRELTQEAAKFTRHCKRRRLTTNDISMALRLRNLEPLYGYSSTALAGRKSNVHGDRKDSQESSGNAQSETLFKRAGTSDTYYVPDEVVDLASFLKVPVPKCPPDVSFTSHWLSVEGVQPAISQNPPVAIAEAEEVEVSKTSTATKAATSKTNDTEVATEKGASTKSSTAKASASAKEKVETKPIVKHELSREQQIYYRSVTEGLLLKDQAYRAHALESLSQDPGLHQLLPYFMQFIAEKVITNLGNLDVLSTMIAFSKALLENDNLYPEPYLHEILPAVLSCIVGKSLCKNPMEDHWSLRRSASEVVTKICDKFKSYANIQSRVSKTMIGALLDPSRTLPQHYGAILTLDGLGPHVVDALIIDSLSTYGPFLTEKLNDESSSIRSDAQKVKEVLLESCGKYLQWQKNKHSATSVLPPPDTSARYAAMNELFGEQLQQYLN